MNLRRKPELPPGLTYDELPAWMRKTQREVDWGLVMALALVVIIAWPLAVRTGLPWTIGIQAALDRTVEVAESFEDTVFYPRWAADFNYGYGSPVWNYLAPLPHHLSGWHYVLAQSNPETSVKLLLLADLGLIGVGTFSFVRRRWGPYAAVLSTAVALFSPQIALVKPYLAGDVSGLLALGLFMVALWAVDRALLGGSVSVAALTLAGLWLAHTPLNVVLFGLLMGWITWRGVIDRSVRPALWRAGLAVGLGTALAACYWLPALWEWDRVRWYGLEGYPGEAGRVFSPGEMLALPDVLDLSAINPAQTPALGLATWGLGLVALVLVFGWFWRLTPPVSLPVARGEALQARLIRLMGTVSPVNWEAAYFGVAGVSLLVWVTPAGGWLWDKLPGWPPLYPRDILPIITLCGAVWVSQVGYVLERTRHRLVLGVGTTVFVGGVALLALPTLYPPAWPQRYPRPALASILREEVRGHALASQVTGLLLPRSVTEMPVPVSSLVASYETELVDKIARDRIPAAVQVDIIEHRTQSERLAARSSSPFTLTLLTFDFAGWQAEIDGQSVPVRAAPSTGFITVDVPAGQHEITIFLGSTLARNLGWAVSIGAGVIAVGVILGLEWGRAGDTLARQEKARSDLGTTSVYLAAVGIMALGRVLVYAAPDWFTRRSPPGIVQTAQAQLPRALLGGIDLLAYDLPDQTVHGGDSLSIALYWRASRPDLSDYQVNVTLAKVDDPDVLVSRVRRRHPGMIPSSQWPMWPLLDYYVRDAYILPTDRGTPPGRYWVTIQAGRCSLLSLLPCETIDPLFVRDNRGGSLGQQIILPLEVEILP